ncbi:unnamed protein product, partial [Ectocarpus fasciculatus]
LCQTTHARALSLPSQLVPAKPALPPEAMAAALSRPRCGFLVWCCWVLVGAAAASRSSSSSSSSTGGGLAFHVPSAPWARAGASRDTSSGRGRDTAALGELSRTGPDRRRIPAVARRSGTSTTATTTTTGMSVSLQPRRYYPRWGQQDDGAPASPLTYRQSPEQKQQQQQQDGSVPDRTTPAAATTTSAASTTSGGGPPQSGGEG